MSIKKILQKHSSKSNSRNHASKQEIRISFQVRPRKQILFNEPESRSHLMNLTVISVISISQLYITPNIFLHCNKSLSDNRHKA